MRGGLAEKQRAWRLAEAFRRSWRKRSRHWMIGPLKLRHGLKSRQRQPGYRMATASLLAEQRTVVEMSSE